MPVVMTGTTKTNIMKIQIKTLISIFVLLYLVAMFGCIFLNNKREQSVYQKNFEHMIDSIGSTSETAPENKQHERLFSFLVDTLDFPVDAETWNSQQQFIAKYIRIAVDEMNEHGHPASVTLAQGIVESASDSSTLAIDTGNLFGIKCHVKDCKDEFHCCQFADDKPSDRFLNFGQGEKSFPGHSTVLNKSRYKDLKSIPKTDFKTYCKMIQYKGYATNKRYPVLLISIIERHNLNKIDFVKTI